MITVNQNQEKTFSNAVRRVFERYLKQRFKTSITSEFKAVARSCPHPYTGLRDIAMVIVCLVQKVVPLHIDLVPRRIP